ncbi:MAG: glutamine--fructose-6-phosphate transaminase (isomerizing) [Pseudomonadota bacterium]
MCGIIGFSTKVAKDPVAVITQHLAYLEYRGYDSTGMAFVDTSGQMHVAKKAGNILALKAATCDMHKQSHFGIGHTRWATHGQPNDVNAHPHVGDEASIIHNGVIENHEQLKAKLITEGFVFQSETDSELIAHTITKGIRQGLSRGQIFKNFHTDLKGIFSIVALFHDGEIIATRYKTPLVFCVSKDGVWLASDALAIAQHAVDGTVCFMKDGDIVSFVADHTYRMMRGTAHFTPIERRHQVPTKGNFAHFMLKEIYEQAEVVQTLRTFLENYNFPIDRPKKLLILGCGTSYYAGLMASYWLQEHACIETDVCIASEFRYQHFMRDYDMCVCISQSGETADVIAAVEIVKQRGMKTIGILNTIESTLGQMVDVVLPICVGPEIGVASTKALIGQLVCLLFMTLSWMKERDHFFSIMSELPQLIQSVLSNLPSIEQLAKQFHEVSSVFFIGRHQMYPVCLEGALKLKELSYINANAYPAGELKHGPIALIDHKTLTIVLVADDHVSEKTLSNAQEVMARQGAVLFASADDHLHPLLKLPVSQDKLLTIFAPIIALQLFSYYVALERGCSIDQPRNLAKSVTVE